MAHLHRCCCYWYCYDDPVTASWQFISTSELIVPWYAVLFPFHLLVLLVWLVSRLPSSDRGFAREISMRWTGCQTHPTDARAKLWNVYKHYTGIPQLILLSSSAHYYVFFIFFICFVYGIRFTIILFILYMATSNPPQCSAPQFIHPSTDTHSDTLTPRNLTAETNPTKKHRIQDFQDKASMSGKSKIVPAAMYHLVNTRTDLALLVNFSTAVLSYAVVKAL
jgi:hypothetical protein